MGNQGDEQLSWAQEIVHESERMVLRHRSSLVIHDGSQASHPHSTQRIQRFLYDNPLASSTQPLPQPVPPLIRHSISIPTPSPHPSPLPTPIPTPTPTPTPTPIYSLYSSPLQATWLKAVKKGLLSFWISTYSQAKVLSKGAWFLVKLLCISWPAKILWFVVKKSWFILFVICSIFYFIYPDPKVLEDPRSILMHSEIIRESTQALAQLANAHIGINNMAQPLRKANWLTYEIQVLIDEHQFPNKTELSKHLAKFQEDTEANTKTFERLPASLATLVNWAQASTWELHTQLQGLQRRLYREIESCINLVGGLICWLYSSINNRFRILLGTPIPLPISHYKNMLMKRFIQSFVVEIVEMTSNAVTVTNGFQASQGHLKSAEKIIRFEGWKFQEAYKLQQSSVFTRWLFPRHQSEIREKLDNSLRAVIDVDTKAQMAWNCTEQMIVGMRSLMEMLNISSAPRLDDGAPKLLQLEIIEEGLATLTEVDELWRKVRMDKVRAML